MPTGYTVDSERRVVFVRAWGVLTDASLRLQAEALGADPKFDPAFGVLVDVREVAVHRVTLRLLQSFPTSFSRETRRAIVVGDVHALALAEAYSGWTGNRGTAMVTRDLGEAFLWLGVSPGSHLPDELDATFDDTSPRSSV